MYSSQLLSLVRVNDLWEKREFVLVSSSRIRDSASLKLMHMQNTTKLS